MRILVTGHRGHVGSPARYQADPWRALVDYSTAQATLGWQPGYRWSDRARVSHDLD